MAEELGDPELPPKDRNFENLAELKRALNSPLAVDWDLPAQTDTETEKPLFANITQRIKRLLGPQKPKAKIKETRWFAEIEDLESIIQIVAQHQPEVNTQSYQEKVPNRSEYLRPSSRKILMSLNTYRKMAEIAARYADLDPSLEAMIVFWGAFFEKQKVFYTNEAQEFAEASNRPGMVDAT